MSTLSEQTRRELPEGGSRQQILDVAAVLFLERGYNGTTLREIAAAVGMKAGSLYYHFSSKEALLLAILQRGVEIVVDAFRETAEAHRSSDPRTRFSAHVRAHFEALREYGPYTAVGIATFGMAPDSVRSTYLAERDAYEEMWSDLLRELREHGDITAEIPIEVVSVTLFGAISFALEWLDPEGRDIDAVVGAIARMFWSGLSARSPS